MAAATDPTSGLPLDTPVVVELPLSAWYVVLAHLNRGVYSEVAQVINSISGQGDTQLLLLMNHARAAKALSPSEATITSGSMH